MGVGYFRTVKVTADSSVSSPYGCGLFFLFVILGKSAFVKPLWLYCFKRYTFENQRKIFKYFFSCDFNSSATVIEFYKAKIFFIGQKF